MAPLRLHLGRPRCLSSPYHMGKILSFRSGHTWINYMRSRLPCASFRLPNQRSNMKEGREKIGSKVIRDNLGQHKTPAVVFMKIVFMTYQPGFHHNHNIQTNTPARQDGRFWTLSHLLHNYDRNNDCFIPAP